jgi:hypothetical protein
MQTRIKQPAAGWNPMQKQLKDHTIRPSLYPTSTAPYTSYSPGKLDILLHDGNSLGMDGAKIGVFE